MTIATDLKQVQKDNKDITKAALEGHLLIKGWSKAAVAKEFKRIGLTKKSSGFFNDTFVPHITKKAMSKKQLEDLLAKESDNCKNGKAHWERIRAAVEKAVENRKAK